MIEVEKYPCRDENEATAREREWFEILNSELNTNVPNRSHQEYYEDNRDNILIQHRQYYTDNRDNILIQKNQYYAGNRDNILIKTRQHYADNRAEIATKCKQTFSCECGKVSTWSHKSRHLKSKIHIQYMERVMSSTDSTIPVVQVVPPITDTQLTRGICYIPLEQFENIKQQEEINDDHSYSSNHYDFMHSHAI
jgi:DNA polymerase sigma